MDVTHLLRSAQDQGRQSVAAPFSQTRALAQVHLRNSLGLRDELAPACEDPLLAYLAPDGPSRRLHGDVPVMLLGGVASLMLQSLHPLAMAGVAQHSNYAEDPLGRLDRTARFIGTTTYGTAEEAQRTISRIKRLHQSVVGVDEQGRSYSASDPALLTWVHSAEVLSFIEAHRRYGAVSLEEGFYDDYLAEMAQVALDLGALEVSKTVEELHDYFEEIRPELEITPGALDVKRFLLVGVGRWPHQILAYQVIVAGARDLLPPWAAEMLGLEHLPGVDRLLIRPAAHTLAAMLRLVVPVPTTSSIPD